MSVPTAVVTVEVRQSDGTAIEGATVTARLTGADIYQDQIVDRALESTTTNASGVATLNLFPNTLGENGTAYVFTIREPLTNRKIYETVAFVPNENCNLTDIAGNVSARAAAPAVEPFDTGIVVRLSEADYSARQIVAPAAGIAIANPDGLAGNIIFGLANDLAALEELAGTGVPQRTAADTWSLFTVSAYGKTLVDDADAPAARSTLGLGTMATQNANAVAITGGAVRADTIRLGSSSEDFATNYGFTPNGVVYVDTSGFATVGRFGNNSLGPFLFLAKGRGTPGAGAIVQSGDTVGSIQWTAAASASDMASVAQIRAEVDGTPGASNDMPGRLLFLTTPDGSGTQAEAMRIDSSQRVIFQVDRAVRFNNQTSAAAGQVGTLTNAPAAGNPGYWLKVNIDGTNYAIPAWAG